MKNKWNNIWSGLLMDAITPGGASGGQGTGSFITAPPSGSKVPPTPGNAGPAPGTSGVQPPVDPTPSPAAAGPAPTDWRSALPKELQDDANLKKFVDIPTLAKSYVNAQKLIGADKIPIPTKYSTDEDWQGVYKKLGLPEKIEEYQVKFKEGVSLDDKFGNDFKAAAYKAGVLPKQAQALADWFSDVNMGSEQSVRAEMDKTYNAGVTELKTKWGNAFDLNVSRANKAAVDVGGAEFVDHLIKTGLGGDKTVIEFLAKVGETLYAEHKFVEGQGAPGAMTPAEIDKKITESQMNPAYLDKNHPQHKTLVADVAAMYEQRYPKAK